jgi:rhamnogalacturonan endolyase
MEELKRGLVAVNEGDGKVFVSWRLLATDPEGVAFNLYRKTEGDSPQKLNETPISQSTNFVDTGVNLDAPVSWFVRPVVDDEEKEDSKGFTLETDAPARQYMTVPVQPPEGYRPNDASVGDLDGDSEYEIVIHMAGRSHDNSHSGFTDLPILQAYEMDGTLLWTINLGINIREGAHYTQFMVYDLDGDGIAEVACKTADGTTDGKGNVIGDPDANWVNDEGRILDGPEYFTVFDGQTGAELATKDYIPPRGDVSGWGGVGGNGGNDDYGNRVDRFLAAIAYLDGKKPSVIMARGYYGRSVLAAWDYRDGKLTSRWVFDTDDGYPKYEGMGNHNLSVADVDDDRKDEIIYGAMAVDDDGTGLYTTGLRHGDALHVSDLDPTRDGLEVWGIHENEEPVPGYENGFGVAFRDAETGEIIFGGDRGKDVGRGVAADIDPRYPGAEMWGGYQGLLDTKGNVIGDAPRSRNFLVWWDGDLLRELLDQNRITKWNWKQSKEESLLVAEGSTSINGSKATPVLSADLFGDWREEVILAREDNQALRIYTTTIPTEYRFYTLMQNPQYRLSIAWQNVAYNQPPHVSYYLGHGMEVEQIHRPDIRIVGDE